MSFSFLTTDNLYDRYRDAKAYTESLTDQFQEYERIARNRPHPDIDPAYPKTTDGTTASIIRKTPRRVIQQLPTGNVVSDSEDWLTHVASFIFRKKILPYANEEYDLIQKAWSTVEKSLTFGACPTYAPFLSHDGYFCPDLSLPYWGDIFMQPGKKSGYACGFTFMRSWWQKEDLQAIIDEQLAQKKKSKTYEPTWDVAALKSVLDSVTTKDEKAQTPSDREKTRQVSTGIELVTGFQKGVGAKFYTFHPQSKQIVRTKTNKDPRGKMPIDWMYGDIDGSNPWGRGIVELVGPLQNLIDADMQMYQFNRALMLAPPLLKKGNFNKNKVKFIPNQIIDLGSDVNADVIPLTVDTTAIANYPALYGLQKSQLLNLTNSPDTSISADVGNPSFSKTPQGVQAQNAVISVDDNYVRKMFEAWFEKWSETAINLYFAERTGIEELQLDAETSMKLREMPDFDQSLINDKNQIRINYDQATPALKFRVDPSTTSVKDNAAQVADATGLLDMVMKYPMLNTNYGGPIDIEILARRIVTNSGIENPEQVAPEPTQAQKQAKEEAKNSPNPFSPLFDKPNLQIRFPDLPPAAQVQLLGLAGIHVSMQDIMQGPVLDPNERGNQAISPQNVPGLLLPGEQPGQGASPAPAPIDIGDIYKLTTDPTVKAQIEKMAGLQPNITHVQNHIETNAAQHIADQASHLGTAADALAPPAPATAQAPQTASPQQGATDGQNGAPDQTDVPVPGDVQPDQMTPEDMHLAQTLQAMGISPDQINRAIAMLNAGHSEQEILQMLGVGQ